MNSIFLLFFTLLTIFSVLLSIILMYRFSKKDVSIYTSDYIKNRSVDSDIKQREKKSMEALKNGDIKCHIILNDADDYDVKEWVSRINTFMEKPIYQQLLSLKGHDIDEGYKKIKAQFIGYDSVFDKIGMAKIEERLCAIHDVYVKFIKASGYKDEEDICLVDRVVMHVILDYFTDIIRLKEFHSIDRVNQDKIIAYEVSWLLRRKPIQILKDHEEDLVYVNEMFAMTIFVNHITSGKIDTLTENQGLYSLCDTLLYYFKYRNCDAKILEMFIMCFKVGNSIDKIEN